MRYCIWCVLMIIALFRATAEDIIVLKDGDVIRVQILEIGIDDVKYKKFSNPNGPIYKELQSNILSITYQNGEIEKFNVVEKSTKNSVIAPDGDNNRLISAINNAQVFTEDKPGGIKNAPLTALWGIKSGSQLSNSVLSFSFEKFMLEGIPSGGEKVEGYKFNLHNKSSNTIYIDLTNSFFCNSTTGSVPFFQNKTFSSSTGGSKNAGFNVGALAGVLGIGGTVGQLAGGLSIGGSINAGNTVIESQSPILVIPPHSFAYLPCERIKVGNDFMDMPYILYFYNRQLGLFSAND